MIENLIHTNPGATLILVVDDSPDSLELISSELMKYYEVHVATDGVRCLELARRVRRPDLILLDVMMPDMDGYEVCRRLKANPDTADIPVLFLSGRTAAEDERIGLEIGATKTVACQFPESYPQEDAAGRPATFTITLKELKSRELPALDDAFAQQASDKETLAALRSDLEDRLKEDAERRNKTNRHNALVEALVEQLEVDLPETLVQQEIRNLIEQTAGQIAEQGMDVKKLFTPDLVRSLMDTSRPEAEQRLRRNLALKALATAEAISVDDDALEAKIKEISRGLSQQANIDPQRLRQAVADDLLQEKLLEWLDSNSTITEKAPATPESDQTEAAQESTKAKAKSKPKTKADKAAATPEGEGDAEGDA